MTEQQEASPEEKRRINEAFRGGKEDTETTDEKSREDVAEIVAGIKHTSLKELQPHGLEANWSAIQKCATLNNCYTKADQIITFFKQANYVKLADDQSLPKEWFACGGSPRGYTEETLIRESWRKVEQ